MAMGIMRATSVFACIMVTPGFRRAMPLKLNCPKCTLARSNW